MSGKESNLNSKLNLEHKVIYPVVPPTIGVLECPNCKSKNSEGVYRGIQNGFGLYPDMLFYNMSCCGTTLSSSVLNLRIESQKLLIDYFVVIIFSLSIKTVCSA